MYVLEYGVTRNGDQQMYCVDADTSTAYVSPVI
jgi:hypothetical protein